MKLLYLSLEPMREGHASYTHVAEICRGLRRRGWNIQLCAKRYTRRSPLPGFIRRLAAIVWLQVRVIFSPRPTCYYLRWHPLVILPVLWAKATRTPIVFEVNGPLEDFFIAWPTARRFERLFQGITRWQLRTASGVITVTPGLGELCKQSVPELMCAVVPNGVNTDLFTTDSGDEQVPRYAEIPPRFAIFHGTFAPWQGLRVLVDALKQPEWPDGVDLVTLGDGAERSFIEEQAAINPRLHYLGVLPYNALPSVLRRAGVALVCNINVENRASHGVMPLKLFESLACGTPVIVTDYPGQADVVRRIACGWVVPPQNAGAVARAVASAFTEDAAIRARRRQAAREAAVNEFSWDHRARDTADFLDQVLATAAGQPPSQKCLGGESDSKHRSVA